MTFHPFKVGAFTHSTKHPLQPSSAHIANQYIPVPYRYNLQSDIPSILIEKGCEICHPFTSLFCSRFNPLDTTLQYHHHHHSPRLYVNRQSLAGRENFLINQPVFRVKEGNYKKPSPALVLFFIYGRPWLFF